MQLNSEKITQAIQGAERNTSGEIQVFLTKRKTDDVYASAKKAFEKIGLGKTAEKNAILFFIAERSRAFAILGDSGIHEKVHQEFWDEIRDRMAEHFQKHEFTEGLCEAITLCGQKLKKYFPYQEDDVNELSDEMHIED